MRQSGILMHITSLPGPYGIGTMGAQARKFVDFLKKSGQSLWQILPLTPTGYGDSPYQSCSTYAGNHYLIDLDTLVEDGLLKPEELTGICWNRTEERVDFGLLYQHRLLVLRKAFSRFVEDTAYFAFCQENEGWLSDFSLFMALKDQNGGKPWYQWEENLKQRKSEALQVARETLHEEMRFYRFIQYIFYRQWNALRAYAQEAGVQIIGDVPIYVPLDSADVWAEPELFELDTSLNPVAVAGCPPDAFSEDGQLWGNPLYRWDVHKETGYAWWIRRMASAAKRYDRIRIDHFRGFESYWSVPYGEMTARNGRWVKGPGIAFIQALKKALPQVQMIAEDLGYLTEEVVQLKNDSGYPGMKLLLFAFDPREPSSYLPHEYTANSVCYTGTHDNMTTRQWYESAEPEVRAQAEAYLNHSSAEPFVWSMIRAAQACVSDTCIIPMQDYLNLNGQARMNFPGTCTQENWTWRMKEAHLTDALAEKICHISSLYGRCNCKTTGKTV